MKIGCPKEIKPQEFRVGLTPQRRAGSGPHMAIQSSSKPALVQAQVLTTRLMRWQAPVSFPPRKRFLQRQT